MMDEDSFLIDLPTPIELVWPMTGLVPLEVVLEDGTVIDSGATAVAHGSRSEKRYVEVREIRIESSPYHINAIEPDNTTSSGTLLLHQDEQYVAIRIRHDEHDRFALHVIVRRQENPNRAGQFIVFADHDRTRLWIEKYDIKPTFEIENDLSERRWEFTDEIGTPYFIGDLVLGVAIAILTPPGTSLGHISGLPAPQVVRIAKGMRRILYRDKEGRFISRDRYEQNRKAVPEQSIGEPDQDIDQVKPSVAFRAQGLDIDKSSRVIRFVLAIGPSETSTPAITLTPRVLQTNVAPYLGAVAEFQQIIEEILNQVPTDISIKAISQNTPISISLEGVLDAVRKFLDDIVPWQRKHSDALVHLAEQEKMAEIETKKVETLEIQARVAREQTEAERLMAEASKQRQEAAKAKLENGKLQLKLYQETIQFMTNWLDQLAPDLSDIERTTYLIKLVPRLYTLISSSVMLTQASDEE